MCVWGTEGTVRVIKECVSVEVQWVLKVLLQSVYVFMGVQGVL
jgi:hypothetical protein